MIPNFEGLSRSSETLNEIFVNYTSALFRVEKLKEQNNEIKLRIDQEKVDGHVKKKIVLPATIHESKEFDYNKQK